MASSHRKFSETTEHTHCLSCGRCLPGLAFCSLGCLLDDIAATLLRALATAKPDAEGRIDLPDLEEDWSRRMLRHKTDESKSEQRMANALDVRDKMRARLASMPIPKRNLKLN